MCLSVITVLACSFQFPVTVVLNQLCYSALIKKKNELNSDTESDSLMTLWWAHD